MKGRVTGMDLEEAKLCPNCARQGQIFPNISKRNQKLVEKVVLNQLVVITAFLNLKNLALRIRRPSYKCLSASYRSGRFVQLLRV